jgi:hypothetical protein
MSMNEANTDLADELTNVRADKPNHVEAIAVEERSTSRLPPVPRPPHLPARPASLAPGVVPTVHGRAGTPELHPPPHASTGWWRSLLTSTMPPPAAAADMAREARPRDGAVERRLALAAALLGLTLLGVGLAIGLWVVSSPLPAAVAAAALIARGLVSLGVLAFGFTLLGIAERLFARARGG